MKSHNQKLFGVPGWHGVILNELGHDGSPDWKWGWIVHSMRLRFRVGTGCVYGTMQDRQGRAGCMMQTKKESVFVLLKGWGEGVFMFLWLRKQTEKSNYECGQFMLLFPPKINCSFFSSFRLTNASSRARPVQDVLMRKTARDRAWPTSTAPTSLWHRSRWTKSTKRCITIWYAPFLRGIDIYIYNVVCIILKGVLIYTMWYASFLKPRFPKVYLRLWKFAHAHPRQSQFGQRGGAYL